ncbi:hypothetical protein LZP73_19125, partial [Shewanella sp. AS16]|uniref:hypothetical protein n=1 Tax=Shewanella sp. AS16 TaxID=2907625 RepID=UPI001F3C8674
MNQLGISLCLLLVTLGQAAATELELHAGSISQRTLWSKDKIHVITSEVKVEPGVELSIEAGAVVKFSPGTRLRVYGALNAVGTSSNKIYFTSYRDDSVGGDSNNDG